MRINIIEASNYLRCLVNYNGEPPKVGEQINYADEKQDRSFEVIDVTHQIVRTGADVIVVVDVLVKETE